MESRNKHQKPQNKNVQKGSRRSEATSGIRMSPIPGVQMLELRHLGNFHIVRQQLHSALTSKYGPVADIIRGKPKYVPVMTQID